MAVVPGSVDLRPRRVHAAEQIAEPTEVVRDPRQATGSRAPPLSTICSTRMSHTRLWGEGAAFDSACGRVASGQRRLSSASSNTVTALVTAMVAGLCPVCRTMEVAERERRAARDELHVREAAEKAWLAVVQATDQYLLGRHGVRAPQDETAHLFRKRTLRDQGEEELKEEYNALEGLLHGDAFYFGDVGEVPSLMGRARRYVERTTGHKVGAH
ncbi:MAG: hypothetical protein KGI98_01740 [Euryarchaeota archaeon]|nr:hypothetical protein [Euryarchaeota archaeon]MDE2045004.1 hypothetical protein [Thermoplasmata archaeon]